MKKNLVALLLVLAVVSVGVFAAVLADTSFLVTTEVTGVNQMKLTSLAEGEGITSKGAFTTAGTWAPVGGSVVAGSDTLPVDGNYTGIAYISAVSNRRAGFKITLTASAMSSDIEGNVKYINYTVRLDNDEDPTTGTATTNNATNASLTVANHTAGISGIQVVSRKISIMVNQDQYNNAVEGNYSGTVAFSMTTD